MAPERGISPMFLMEAAELLNQSQPAAAFDLCRRGLAQYPEYATAYLVAARAAVQLRDFNSAISLLADGTRRFPQNRSLAQLAEDLGRLDLDAARDVFPNQEKPILLVDEIESAESQAGPAPLGDSTVEPAPEPEIIEPEDKQDEVIAPEDEAAESEAPEPEIIEPEDKQDEVIAPEDEAAESEAPEPEIIEPEDKQDEVVEPEDEAAESEATEPEIIAPEDEAAESEAPEPEVIAPEDKQDEVSEPAPEPEIIAPETPAKSPGHSSHLRIIETAPNDRPTGSAWRSRNIRLIPGLEFTPLRFESHAGRTFDRSVSMPEPPAFPNISTPQEDQPPSATDSRADERPPEMPQRRVEESQARDNLKEFARQMRELNSALPHDAISGKKAPQPPVPRMGELPVSETLANLYVGQKAWSEAIHAFEVLARYYPDRAAEFEARIAELRAKSK